MAAPSRRSFSRGIAEDHVIAALPTDAAVAFI
jgi:hypothetical protein